MYNIDWPENQENIFGAVIRIAHYTHFSKNEILNWTIDEIHKALSLIEVHEQKQAQLHFAIADYNILMDTVPTDKQGNVKSSEREDILAQARKIRKHFTGEETEKENQINNLDIITKGGYNIVGEMTKEEYLEAKKQYDEAKKIITDQYGT